MDWLILKMKIKIIEKMYIINIYNNNKQSQQQQKEMSLGSIDVQDIIQRSTVHEFASQAQKNNFNIRKFTESRAKSKKQTLRTKYTQLTKNRISTEPVEDRIKNMNTVMSYTNAFERIMNKTEPDYNKRMALTGSLKHSFNRQVSLTKSQNDKHEEATCIQSEKAKKCKQINKKYNKGPLKKRIIETWLNNILTQSTQFQVIDETLGNAALKKFQIDQNSMLSRGIKPQNIQRIYQSLFVHSIGFNNSIKQLVTSNNQVMKNIWKVFSILLQYCAEGKFQTMIGVIERDKTIRLQQLREQIAKRQEIIQRNDQLNQNKNIQIFKQIKHLKQQNINLTNEKEILFQDYQKTQQAFNEEVALRLKFENKINQLFGVHRQLAIKHQRLYEQHKKKLIDWNLVNQKNMQITQLNSQLKIQINDLVTEKQRLICSEKYNKQLINEIKDQKVKLNSNYNSIKHQYDEQRRINKEQRRRVTQLQIQNKNLTQIVGLKDKSWKETHQEYQLSLQENNRLYTVINQQRIQVEQLLFEKKQFNNKILNLMAQASFERKKKQQFTKLFYETDKRNKEMNDKIKNLELENKILTKKNISIQQDLKADYQNIQKMHERNNILQDELQFLRRFRDNLDTVLIQKDTQTENLRVKNQQLLKQIEELKTSFNKLEMNYKILKAEFQSSSESYHQKFEKLKEEREALQSGDNQKNRLLIITRSELQKNTKILQNTILDLKNQKFQRVHLKANYDQSLNIIQKKNDQQKQMGRQISQLKDVVLKRTQQKNRLELNLQNEINKRKKCEQELAKNRQEYSKYKQERSSHVHPFIYEDYAEHCRIFIQKLGAAYNIIKEKQEQIAETHQRYRNQINSINKSNNQFIASFKTEKQKQIYQKQSELQYEKQINSKMKVKLEKLQQLADTYMKKIQQRTSSQKQKIYAQVIQQKSKSIQALLAKLNIENTKNDQLKLQIRNINHKNQQQIIILKQNYKFQIQKKDEQINDLRFQKNYIQNEIKKLKEQIKQNQQKFQQKLKERMEVYMQNFKSVEDNSIGAMKSMNDQNQQSQLFKDTKIKWSMLDDLQKKNPAIKKRNDISRKLKISYTYYQHK